MRSIRAKITWALFSSVLIASLIIGTFGIFLTSNVIKESSTENMRLLCKNNADKIDVIFAKVEESINTLAHYAESELPNIQSLQDDSFRKAYSADIQKNALHHIESVDGAVSVYLYYDKAYIGKTAGFFYVKYEDNGEFEYSPLTKISASPTEDNDQQDWWHIPTIRGYATWFEAYYDANLERHIISYVVPIYKNEQLIGVIGADISADYIENIVKDVSVFNSGQAAILKSDGTVLYHPNFERGALIGAGDPGFSGVIDKLKKQNTTNDLIAYKLKGEPKRLTSCKLRNGMLMVCFAPEAEIYYQQTMLTFANLVMTTVVVLVALFIAFFVSQRLASPIKKLNEAAKHLVDGEFDFDIHSDTYDEIGELTTTFIETRKVLKHQIHLLDTEAHRDGLTGVGNKSAFMDREAEINQQIAAENADFSIVVFDVNKLKVTNDVFGHMAGDRLLLTVANYLAAVFDASNVYRLGGDEFVVILPEEESVNNKEKLAACMAGMRVLSVEGYPGCKVSCAYGFSRLNPVTDHQLTDVLHRADKEMYKNKTETKKETYPWQEGFKGIKQLQIDKYCELLQSLKESTDDYLLLMNVETGFIRFFGGHATSFNIANGRELSDEISKILAYVHTNDHALVKDTIQSIINRDTETVNINFRIQHDSSNMRWVNCRGNVIKDETDSHFVLIGRISQNAVKHLYNPVTTLFNKIKLKSDLQQGRVNQFGYLMLIDIDNLSEINLKHGSMHGDTLLKTLAEELERRFSMWQIYHAEKDRFVVLLDTDSNKEIMRVFEDIKDALSGHCSISASVVPNDSTVYVSAENIYDYAVQILNNSKKNGIGNIAFFSKDSLLERISEVELWEELERSVKKDCRGFHLVYQPQINAEDYSIVSAETLLRFESETKGQVYPDQFIPILEQTGWIHEVGIWVINEALCQCRQWRQYDPTFQISVNISPKQLEKKRTASQIIRLLSKYDLPGEALILEITESTQLDENEEVFAVLTKLRQAGVQIAIDDFGTGYSNLGNLKHLHANILKVDRVFIQNIKENGYNYNLIYNILEFARSNSLKVCLEGVETKQELLVVAGLYPDMLQGYLFDKPCSARMLEATYFQKDSEQYRDRVHYIDQLSREKRHAPIVNMETKTILSGLDIGLWIIRMDAKTGEGELYTDEIMRKLLGVDDNSVPKDCYTYWRNNIREKDRAIVDAMVSDMTVSGKVMQVEYWWKHPQVGEVYVRCSGRCTHKDDETIVFEGFHRIISDLEGTSF